MKIKANEIREFPDEIRELPDEIREPPDEIIEAPALPKPLPNRKRLSFFH